MTQSRILVIGSANADLVTRVPRCPKAGESLIGHSFTTVPGGKGANQAVAAARLGAATCFAGCIGRDALGEVLCESMRGAGVDLSALRRHETEPTGTAVIFVAEDGQNAIVVTPAANYGLRPGDIEAMEPLFATVDVVLMQLEIPLDTVDAALRMARQAAVLSILDAGPAQTVPDELLGHADIVSPNETEVEAMTGVSIQDVADAPQAAQALRDSGAKEVVLKLGRHGAYYLGKDEVHVPGFTVDAIDTVAAGDAFTAALALRWNRCEVTEALRFANAAGALSTTVLGAQPSMPTLEAVETFLTDKEAAL